jgi:hypothetical protein
MMENNIKVFALYLPQFHPIPENDEWWGKGFTEWTNVGKAKSLFNGHVQPRVPSELGYYDLRLEESRVAQAKLAKEYGISAFVYWHYWFGEGKRLLERPFNEVLETGKPDFPFFLAWANESWKGFVHGLSNRNVLIEQKYPGKKDYEDHFNSLLPAFKDKRYVKINGMPVFMIYKPLANDEIKIFIQVWRKLAIKNGLKGIYFIGHSNSVNYSIDKIINVGVDAVNTVRLDNYLVNHRSIFNTVFKKVNKILRGVPLSYTYKQFSKYFIDEIEDKKENVYPSIIPGWDHSPRSGKEGLVIINNTPELFEKHVQATLNIVKNKKDPNKIVFIKSWNEWAEGNFMEPDIIWGRSYLQKLKNQLDKLNNV